MFPSTCLFKDLQFNNVKIILSFMTRVLPSYRIRQQTLCILGLRALPRSLITIAVSTLYNYEI